MTIPRKLRRTIKVDGVNFHYSTSFAIERSERMVIQVADGAKTSLFIFPFAILKPSHIANAIRFAMARGWAPTQRSENVWLAFDVNAAGESQFELIPNNDFRVVTYPTQGEPSAGLDLSKFSDTRPWYHRPSPAGILET
jgi:hypothetical protein